MKRFPFLLLFVAGVISAQGLPDGNAPVKPLVLTTVYPIQWVCEVLLEDQADVVNLTAASKSPRNWRPDADAKKAVGRAALVVMQGGTYETWKPDLKEDRVFFSSEAIYSRYAGKRKLKPGTQERFYAETEGITWFDPLHLSLQAQAIAERVSALPDVNGQRVAARLQLLRKQLETLTDGLHAERRLHSQFGGAMHPAFAWALQPAYGWRLRSLPREFAASLDTGKPDWKSFREFYEFYPVDYLLFLNEPPPADVGKRLNSSLMITLKVLDSLERPDAQNTAYPDRMKANFNTLTRGFTL